MGSDDASVGSVHDQTQQKDRRKKRTSSNQYMMYLEMLEDDPIFAGGRITRDVDMNYLPKKWKELAMKLNTCSTGPRLTAEEWRKRLNDWKNTTRCKYRRSMSGEKDITLTSLELKALELFGKTAPTNSTSMEHLALHLKEEKEGSPDLQRTSTSLQKQLQAAVDEAISGADDDDDDRMQDDQNDHEELLTMPITTTSTQTHEDTDGGGGGRGNTNRNNSSNSGNNHTTTTYRTIVLENATQYTDDDNDEEFMTQHRRPATISASSSNVGGNLQTVVSAQPTVTKLINGDIPIKRLRSQTSEPIIYEVKKTPINQRTITVHNASHTNSTQYQQPPPLHPNVSGNSFVTASLSGAVSNPQAAMTSQDAREISRQLKRLADINAEKLKFDIARFKFNNPGFHFNVHL